MSLCACLLAVCKRSGVCEQTLESLGFVAGCIRSMSKQIQAEHVAVDENICAKH